MNYKDFLRQSGTLKEGEGLVSDENVVSYYMNQFPNTFPATNNGLTKRWKLPIKVFTQGIERAELALDELSEKVGIDGFFERVHSVPDNGLVFVEGLASKCDEGDNLYADRVTFGNTSRYNDNCNVYNSVTEKDGCEICGVYFIHLGSHKREGGVQDYKHDDCPKRHEIAMHEVAHALGLYSHHADFGSKKSVIGKHTFRAIKTLYSNDIGTPYTSLVTPQFNDLSLIERVWQFTK